LFFTADRIILIPGGYSSFLLSKAAFLYVLFYFPLLKEGWSLLTSPIVRSGWFSFSGLFEMALSSFRSPPFLNQSPAFILQLLVS